MPSVNRANWEPAVRAIAAGERTTPALDKFSARTLISVFDACGPVNRRRLLALPVAEAVRVAFQAMSITRLN